VKTLKPSGHKLLTELLQANVDLMEL